MNCPTALTECFTTRFSVSLLSPLASQPHPPFHNGDSECLWESWHRRMLPHLTLRTTLPARQGRPYFHFVLQETKTKTVTRFRDSSQGVPIALIWPTSAASWHKRLLLPSCWFPIIQWSLSSRFHTHTHIRRHNCLPIHILPQSEDWL